MTEPKRADTQQVQVQPQKPALSQPKVSPQPLPSLPLLAPKQASKPQAAPAAPKQAPAKKIYRVYLGGFSSRAQANEAKQRYEGQGLSPLVRTINGRTVLQIGVYSSASAARSMAAKTGAAVQAE